MNRPPDPAGTGAGHPQDDLWGLLRPADVVAMLDHLTDGMFVFDADSHFRYVNEPAAELLGRPREELLGAHAWTLFPEAVGGPSYLAYEQARRDRRPVRVTEYYEPLEAGFEVRVFPVGDDLVVLFRDITELQRAEEELRDYAARMSEAERIARFGVWRWDIATGSVRWSDELHRLFGVEPGEFGGTVDDFVARLHPDDRDHVLGLVTRAVETFEPFAFEERIVWPDGTERLLLSQGRVIAGANGSPQALVGVCHDITERVRAQRALGMSDRRLRAIVDNSPSVIAVKDLEGRFRMANAESGRILGLTADDLIGRACSELFPAAVAEQLLANDQAAASDGRPVFDETILTIGDEARRYATVTFPLPDQDGRPTEICTIGTDVTERHERESERRERREWRDRIAASLGDGRMLVYAQPVLDVATGEETSCELLVRMRAEDGDGLIQPFGFLPMAERFGAIQSIDAWVVRQALRLTGAHRCQVNLSAVTLSDPDARREIVGLLASAPEAASGIIFEITETAALGHLEAASSFAHDVTSLGCAIALDDFGTGFGSFTYLRTLPLRYLKIDLTFVTGMVDSVDDRRIVQSIIGIAGQFGLRTIAEGVEDQATLDLLREMGADYVQGFHLGRPAPVASLDDRPAGQATA